jgi:hypothetical protein
MQQHDLFKMSKFRNVAARTNTHNGAKSLYKEIGRRAASSSNVVAQALKTGK